MTTITWNMQLSSKDKNGNIAMTKCYVETNRDDKMSIGRTTNSAFQRDSLVSKAHVEVCLVDFFENLNTEVKGFTAQAPYIEQRYVFENISDKMNTWGVHTTPIKLKHDMILKFGYDLVSDPPVQGIDPRKLGGTAVRVQVTSEHVKICLYDPNPTVGTTLIELDKDHATPIFLGRDDSDGSIKIMEACQCGQYEISRNVETNEWVLSPLESTFFSLVQKNEKIEIEDGMCFHLGKASQVRFMKMKTRSEIAEANDWADPCV